MVQGSDLFLRMNSELPPSDVGIERDEAQIDAQAALSRIPVDLIFIPQTSEMISLSAF